MGQKKSKHSSWPRLDETTLRRITATTQFLPDEIHYFYYDFLKYTPTGYLTLADFEKFYQSLFFAGVPQSFASFVFDAFDINRDGRVDFEEFITGLYYTTKAKPADKIRWAFDLCDRDNDHQLDVPELENVIRALYELSDADMARVETYDEAMQRIKTLLLANQEDSESEHLLDSVTKSEFVDIVQKDATIMKLIDCRPIMSKGTSKGESFSSAGQSSKKQLKFKPSLHKSLSDSTLSQNENEG